MVGAALVLHRSLPRSSGRWPTCPRGRASTGRRRGSSSCSARCATTSRPRAPSPCGSGRPSRRTAGARPRSRRPSRDPAVRRYDDATPDVVEPVGHGRRRRAASGWASATCQPDDGFAAGQPEYVFQVPLAGTHRGRRARRHEPAVAAQHQEDREERRAGARRRRVRPAGLPPHLRRDRRARPLHAARARVLRARCMPRCRPRTPSGSASTSPSTRATCWRRRSSSAVGEHAWYSYGASTVGQARAAGLDGDPVADDAGLARRRRRASTTCAASRTPSTRTTRTSG